MVMSATVHINTLKIDDKEVSAREGQTIMQVAEENGIAIPGLCRLGGLSDVGACRLCIVEVVGNPRLLPACTTRAIEGMEILTRSPRLDKYRKTILEMLFAERNHICAVCASNGHCELQTLAMDLGVDHVRVPYLSPSVSIDASHRYYMLDHNRCILCTRCVRVCDEIEGAHTKDVRGRGIDSRIINDLDEKWGDSETCTTCGKCVHVCPTGALIEKGSSVAEMAKQRRFLPYLTLMRNNH